MNDASLWRTAVAEEIARAYAAQPDVLAVILGGSVARGWADRYSDVELGILWQDAPSRLARETIAVEAGGSSWIDYEYDAELDEWAEEYTMRGLKIDVSHRTPSMARRIVDDVIVRYDTSLAKQNVLAALADAHVLHGQESMEQFITDARTYPDQLAVAMVRKHLSFGPHWWLGMLAARRSYLSLYDIFCRAERAILGVLMGINRVYTPGEKWAGRLASSFAVAPVDLAGRLEAVFLLEPAEAVIALRTLIEDTMDIVDLHVPQIDTQPVRARLQRERPPLDGPQ
jgi:hypothetical protein